LTVDLHRCKEKGHYSNECTEELPATSEKKGTNLLINKEDGSDDEMQSDDKELSDPQKSSTDPDDPDDPDDKNESNDSPYEEDAMFSEDDYEGFSFIQNMNDINCNINNKAIPDSWILLDSQWTYS